MAPKQAPGGRPHSGEGSVTHRRHPLKSQKSPLNELDGCENDVPLLKLDRFEDVFAIDGGSTDGTVEYLQAQGMKVFGQNIPGYNGAYITAFRKCSGDALVFFHPKGCIDPAVVLKFRRYFDDGHDLVVASRIMRGGVNEEDRQLFKPRKWFVIALALISALLWKREGDMVWDVLHGCRGMQKDAFFAIHPLENSVSIDLEMVVGVYRKKMKRIEFPVSEEPRLSGTTHFRALPTGKQLLKHLVKELWR